MIKVEKANVQVPPILNSAACLAHLNLILSSPGVVTVDSNIYRGTIIRPDGKRVHTVAGILKDLYNSKCAYCEKMCYDPEVEHFRPKSRVVGGGGNNKGYYWLCYEWTNLLPSCHECNSITAKGTKFPISGVRNLNIPVNGNPPAFDSTMNVYDSPYLLAEQPLLIHPEYCNDFTVHFDFTQSGQMNGLTPQGIATVSNLKLDNETLNGMRREIYLNFLVRLEKAVYYYKRPVNARSEDWFTEEIADIVIDLVQQSQDPTLTFTLFRKSLLSKIEYFFVDRIDPIFRKEVKGKMSEALLSF